MKKIRKRGGFSKQPESIGMIGAELRAARISLGLSQEELTASLGVHAKYERRTVIAWEHGQNKIPPAVEKLIHIFLDDPSRVKFPHNREEALFEVAPETGQAP